MHFDALKIPIITVLMASSQALNVTLLLLFSLLLLGCCRLLFQTKKMAKVLTQQQECLDRIKEKKMNATNRQLSTKDRFIPTECSVCHKFYATEMVVRHWQQMSNSETNRSITNIHDLNMKGNRLKFLFLGTKLDQSKHKLSITKGKSSTTTSSNNKITTNTDSDITINTGDIHHNNNDNKDSNMSDNKFKVFNDYYDTTTSQGIHCEIL